MSIKDNHVVQSGITVLCCSQHNYVMYSSLLYSTERARVFKRYRYTESHVGYPTCI